MTKGEMRASYGARNREIIKRDDLAMAIASCTLEPHIVREGKQIFFVVPYYEKIFAERAAYEYLVFHWLYVFTKSAYRNLERGVGYSRHLVNHVLWHELARDITKRPRAENFVKLARKKSESALRPLKTLVDVLIREAMICYRKNKRFEWKLTDQDSRPGVYAELDYFKRSVLLKEWKGYWDDEETRKTRERVARHKEDLLLLLDQ